MTEVISGWYEFPKEPQATTHIAYVYENDDIYLPESGVTKWDFLAAKGKGTAKLLVRSTQVEMAVKALVHTVEYVGFDTLPAIIGWSWYDALIELDPGMAREMKHTYLKHLKLKESNG